MSVTSAIVYFSAEVEEKSAVFSWRGYKLIFFNVVVDNTQTHLLRMLASVKRLWYLKLMESFFDREKGGVLVKSSTPFSRVNLIQGAKRLFV